MNYDRTSLKTHLYFFLPMFVAFLVFFPYILFHLLPLYGAMIASIIVVAGVLLLMVANLKETLLGPSIYSNGISLGSKNPFRFHGRFVRFSEIKLVRMGLDDKKVSDVGFLQRYVDDLGSRWYGSAEDAMEDMFDSIFLVTVSGEIIKLEAFIATEEDRFIRILEEKDVRYAVAQHVQDLMDLMSDNDHIQQDGEFKS